MLLNTCSISSGSASLSTQGKALLFILLSIYAWLLASSNHACNGIVRLLLVRSIVKCRIPFANPVSSLVRLRRLHYCGARPHLPLSPRIMRHHHETHRLQLGSACWSFQRAASSFILIWTLFPCTFPGRWKQKLLTTSG